MAHLILVRGLPGSGKTTLAKMLSEADTYPLFAADDFFMVGGTYSFDPKKIEAAHLWCQNHVRAALQSCARVIVHNTFSQRWEMEPYIQMVQQNTDKLSVIDLYDGGLYDGYLAERNIHGVPVETIARMRARWEHNWKDGNPLPPWKRKK